MAREKTQTSINESKWPKQHLVDGPSHPVFDTCPQAKEISLTNSNSALQISERILRHKIAPTIPLAGDLGQCRKYTQKLTKRCRRLDHGVEREGFAELLLRSTPRVTNPGNDMGNASTSRPSSARTTSIYSVTQASGLPLPATVHIDPLPFAVGCVVHAIIGLAGLFRW